MTLWNSFPYRLGNEHEGAKGEKIEKAANNYLAEEGDAISTEIRVNGPSDEWRLVGQNRRLTPSRPELNERFLSKNSSEKIAEFTAAKHSVGGFGITWVARIPAGHDSE